MTDEPYQNDPGPQYLVLNGTKLTVNFIKRYYLTGLDAALKEEAESRVIHAWLSIALGEIVKVGVSWSESEFRKQVWDMFFLISTFTIQFDIEFVEETRKVLDRVYDYIWGFPKPLKKAFAKESDATDYPILVKKLTAFGHWQKKKKNLGAAQLVQMILADIKSFYSIE